MPDVPLDAEVSWYEALGVGGCVCWWAWRRFGFLVSESVVDFGGDCHRADSVVVTHRCEPQPPRKKAVKSISAVAFELRFV
jgi:hypothetical protein